VLVPQSYPLARWALLLLCCAFMGCFPPEGPPPDADDGRSVNGAFDPTGFAPQNAMQTVDLPEKVPFTAWTRTAPLSLVDESGTHVALISGHGTRVEVTHLLKARALVRCTGCETPVEGWLQREVLRTEVTVDTAPQAQLSEHMRQQRAALKGATGESGQIAALDAGCVVLQQDPTQAHRAVCPPSSDSPTYTGTRVYWTYNAEGWTPDQQTPR